MQPHDAKRPSAFQQDPCAARNTPGKSDRAAHLSLGAPKPQCRGVGPWWSGADTEVPGWAVGSRGGGGKTEKSEKREEGEGM